MTWKPTMPPKTVSCLLCRATLPVVRHGIDRRYVHGWTDDCCTGTPIHWYAYRRKEDNDRAAAELRELAD